MKILITGGAGFIGCNAAARFIRRRDEVTVVDNLSRRGTEENLQWLRSVGSFEFVKADIRDRLSMAQILSERKKLSVVLHLAAQVAVTTSVLDPREDFDINALGTLNLLEAIRESGRDLIFLFSSTNKVYGNLGDLDIKEGRRKYSFRDNPQGVTERQNLDCYSPYGCSKGCADQYVRDYNRIYGLRTVVLRQSCIYGSRQFGVEDQGWLAWFIIAGVLGLPITIYGNGKQVRDVLFVDDLLDCFDKVVEHIGSARGQIYNVGGGAENQVSLLEFLDLLSELRGKEIKPAFAARRPGDQPIYVSDISKARKQLGWQPKVGVGEGVQRLYDWVLANKETVKKVLHAGS